jgi:hypothetical protein
VWTARPGEAWAAGQAGTLLHFTGGVSTAVPFDTMVDFGAVWGSASNDAWAVGATPQFEQPPGSVAAHWDGRSWSKAIVGTGTLGSVWGSAATDVWATTTDAEGVEHWDGQKWTWTSFDPDDRPLAVGGSAGDAWIVGEDGLMLQFDGASWTHRSTRFTTANLSAIGGTGPNDVWAVGGAALHYDGTAWSTVPTPATAAIGAVFGTSSSDEWAIVPFAAENILHWDGRSWSVSLTGHVNLYDGWASGPGDAWAVGDRQVLHWDGSAWSDATFDASIHFSNVWGTARDNVWAIGSDATASSPNAIITHWDGASWTRAALPSNGEAPLGIWGSNADDVWLGGLGSNLTGGSLFHFDGSSWSSVVTGASAGLYAVGGGARDDIWALAVAQDPIVHFDGTSWSVERLPTHPVLSAMWGIGRNQERLVGDRGVILRRCP